MTEVDDTSTPHWHSLDVDRTIEILETDAAHGLGRETAAARLDRYGANELAVSEQRGLAAIVAAQLADFMIIVLLVAAVVAGIVGDVGDSIAIGVIVLINAAVGATQEYRAQRAVAALKRLGAPSARVVREGGVESVSAAELVPGDVVRIAAGDVVPADVRLIHASEMEADESLLTGESQSVAKHARTLPDDELGPGDRHNIAFKQTWITKGRGVGVVVGTGLATEIGRIAALLAEHGPSRTPLQRRLAVFGRRLALVVLAICALVFALGLATGQPPLLMFLTAVSLAVAAIPEALPAMVTVALAIGARKLTRQHSLVRRLPAVESLGSVTFICADKTGTLTENRMTLGRLVVAGRSFDALDELPAALRTRVGLVLALCNEIDPADPAAGDPTETSLYDAARSAGFDKSELLGEMPELALLAFDSDRKRMASVHRTDTGSIALCKGASEQIFAVCDSELDDTGSAMPFDRVRAERAVERLAGDGYRVLALAQRELDDAAENVDAAAVEARMSFVGLVGLHDPIRAEVPRAVEECRTAGIEPVMITGDHPQTALAVARELGLVDGAGTVVTGAELDELDDAALGRQLLGTRVFARVNPAQKIRLVEVLQARGEFVAMTGDGVNDAPALKTASIGVAMGKRGTDVAREAADMVLLDDNFATIVGAVREGRRIYDNILKFIKYTMTSNAGEILVLLLAPLIGLPLPLVPIQILWINLVTDGLPGLAFSAEPAERNVMSRPPRSPRESMFARGMWQHMAWVGVLIGGLSLGTAAWADLDELTHWQTMVFTTLVTAQLAQALAIRSATDSLLTIGWLTNRYMIGALALAFAAQMAVTYVPVLNPVFKTTPLPPADLALCVGLGALVLPLVELDKWRKRALARRPSASCPVP